VLPSIVIGDDVTVGAGSVVNAHLLESGTYAGIPARKIL
jgi:serine acetyltransferase